MGGGERCRWRISQFTIWRDGECPILQGVVNVLGNMNVLLYTWGGKCLGWWASGVVNVVVMNVAQSYGTYNSFIFQCFGLFTSSIKLLVWFVLAKYRLNWKKITQLCILPSCWKHFHKVVPQTCGKFSNSAFTVHFIFLEESWFLQLYQVSSLIKPFHFIRRAAPSPENLKFSSWFLQRLPPLSLLSTFPLLKLWSCANRAFDPPFWPKI